MLINFIGNINQYDFDKLWKLSQYLFYYQIQNAWYGHVTWHSRSWVKWRSSSSLLFSGHSQRLTEFSYTHATLRNNVTQWLTAILMLIGIICIYYFYLNIVFHEKTSYLDIFNLNLNHNYVWNWHFSND